MQLKGKIDFSIAILISLILVVFDLLGESLDHSLSALFTWLPFVVMAASIIIACKGYGKDKKNEIKFIKVFMYGMKITMAVTIILVAYRLLYLFVLFPETKTITIEKARSEMASLENVSESEINEALDLIGRIFVPFAIVGSIVSTMLSGIIGSVISASVAKKKNIPTFLFFH